MNEGRWCGVLLGWVVLSMLSCSLVTGERPTVEPAISLFWQETVDAMDALTQDLGLPQHLMQENAARPADQLPYTIDAPHPPAPSPRIGEGVRG